MTIRKRWLVWPALILIVLFLLFIVIDRVAPLPDLSKGYSTIIYSDDGKILHGFLSKDDKWRIRADYEEISGDLCDAIIFKEDKYFYWHPGINPLSVARALYNNTLKGRRTSGASTITMQLARLLKPANRTIGAKVQEAFRALQLEFHLSKREILTLYLNLLPYGGNIEGVKSASMIYFDQQPRELSPAQIAMLTVIPNNPNALKPSNRVALLNNRNHWLLRMGKAGIFTKQEVDDALAEGFESVRYSIPRKAAHLAYRLKGSTSVIPHDKKPDNLQLYLTGGNDRIYTTLDVALQHKVETSLGNYVRALRSMQITNASVIVVNNRTMKVVAYAGSAGFDENEYSGQVDGVRAIRSPGSALKPALYMLAFDRGYVSPKSVVPDVPVNFSGYSPENYDQSYRGSVTIEQALALSLNVPAVELLDRVGLSDLNTLLANARFRWIAKNRKKTGLSLILGGCGTTLEELTGLYAAFANRGVWQPLQYTKIRYNSNQQSEIGSKEVGENGAERSREDKRLREGGTDKATGSSVVLGSPGSAYMITEILTELKRPDLPNEYREAANLPKIAWKTGTSYGRRDAWAIGYNADYTVGVWTGNFSGRGIYELNGTDCAVPLLFMIFNHLNAQNSDWFVPTADVDFRLVCTETGMMPDTFCHNRIMETYLPGISPSVKCNHMKPVFTNANETVSYCSECMPAAGYKTVLYPNYLPQLINYYEEMMIPYKRIPDHNAACTAIIDERGPDITSLTDGAEYLVIAGRKQQLMLKCSPENGINTIYWYVNKKFYKKTTPEQAVYLQAEKGQHNITCSDDRGRSTTINIRVTYI